MAGDDGVLHGVRPPRSARLLARLAVDVNRFVSVGAIAEALWLDGRSPRRPDRAVHDAAADLRRFFRESTGAECIETRTDGKGYRLVLPSDALDADVAARLFRAGHLACERAEWGPACTHLTTALALFRGRPFEEFGTDPFAAAEIQRLEILRVEAHEALLVALASQGDRTFLTLVGSFVAEHPGRSRVVGHWMTMLAADGRQPEALEVFQKIRRQLAERGLEPAEDLRDLDRRIAIGDAAPIAGPGAKTGHARALSFDVDPTSGPYGVPLTDHDGEARRVDLPQPLVSTSPNFVGRHLERAVLDRLWVEVQHGASSAVALTGEEGIGKSSLVARFARSVSESGGVALAGWCQPETSGSYQPLASAFKQHLGAVETTRRNMLLDMAGDGVLSMLLAETTGPTRHLPDASSVHEARHRLFDDVVALLRGVASGHPTIFIVEDLHWADQNTIDLIRFLVRTVQGMPVLFLLTAREDELGEDHPFRTVLSDLVRHPCSAHIRLDGFDRRATEDFLTVAWPELTDPDLLAEPMRRTTEGNPLFVSEVIHELRRNGVSTPAASVALLEGSLVPRGISEVTKRRFIKLSSHAREVMSSAAIIGQSFSTLVLEALGDLGARPDIFAGLDECVAAGILSEARDSGELTFRHRYFRDVAYNRLIGHRRADGHLRVAHALMRLGQGTSARLLAHHLLAAGPMGDVDAAVDAAVVAARQAVSQLDASDAVGLLRRALELLDRVGSVDLRRRCEVELLLARVLTQSGDFVTAKVAAQKAWDLARKVGDTVAMVHAALEHGRFGSNTGVDHASVEILKATLAAVGAPELRSQILSRLSYHLAAFGGPRQEAEVFARQAVVLAEASGHGDALSRALWSLGLATLGFANARERLACASRLIGLAEVSGDREALANGLRLRVLASLALGQMTACAQSIERLSGVADELGSWIYECDVHRWRATIAQLEGRWQDAEAHVERNGRKGHEQLAFTVSYVGQRLLFARERGEFMLARHLAAMALTHAPGADVFRVVTTAIDAECGDDDAMKRAFDAFTQRSFEQHPTDGTDAMTLALLIETAAHLRIPVEGYEADMRHHGGSLVLSPWGEGCLGAADRYIALALAGKNDFDAAIDMFANAAALEERLGLIPQLARTYWWWATAITWRDGQVSADARRVLGRGKDAARRGDVSWLEQRCGTVVDQAGTPLS